MMAFFGLVFVSSMSALALVSAELYSDVESTERDETKALEIKAKDFWQGLMESAQGLETTKNAELSARVELALKKLPSGYNVIREHFDKAIGHLANADSMLFEEASRSKMMALQRLENGESHEALCDYVSENEDYLYTAYTRFVGYRTYEKKLGRHILSRLKEMEPALDRATEMAPQMYDQSEKASNSARAVMTNRKLGHTKQDDALRKLAGEIISATGKQRMRFQDYLFGSLLTTAQDLAGEKEKPSQTVMKASLRGFDLAKGPSKPIVQVELDLSNGQAKSIIQVEQKNDEKETATISLRSGDNEPPLIFFDGVPVDAEPIVL